MNPRFDAKKGDKTLGKHLVVFQLVENVLTA
jgi:hypothetical protein